MLLLMAPTLTDSLTELYRKDLTVNPGLSLTLHKHRLLHLPHYRNFLNNPHPKHCLQRSLLLNLDIILPLKHPLQRSLLLRLGIPSGRLTANASPNGSEISFVEFVMDTASVSKSGSTQTSVKTLRKGCNKKAPGTTPDCHKY